jgi:hypothetical protein
VVEVTGAPGRKTASAAACMCSSKNLPEKAGLGPLFPKLFPKPTGFWEKLKYQNGTCTGFTLSGTAGSNSYEGNTISVP